MIKSVSPTGSTTTALYSDPVTKVLLGAEIHLHLSDFDPNAPGYDTVFLKGALHEIGHTMGLDHPPDPQVTGKSVMNGRSGVNDINNLTPTEIQTCDIQSVNRNPQCATPTPTPAPTRTPTPYCFYPANPAQFPTNNGCPSGRVNQSGCCICSRSDIFIQQCFQNGGDKETDFWL